MPSRRCPTVAICTLTCACFNRGLLLGVLREALGDAATMDRLAAFTAVRRDALAQILDRLRIRGQIPALERPETLIGQAFGLPWYQMIFAHQALDEHAAADLAAALATQVGAHQEG